MSTIINSLDDWEKTREPLARGVRPVFGDLILVERLPPRTTTDGGLEIPEVAREKSIVARVVAVGRGKRQFHKDWDLPVSPIVEVGMLVLVDKWEGAEFEVDGRKLLSMQEGGVLGEVTEL